MADDSMVWLDGVRKAIEEGDGDFLRETVHLLAQGVMEAEVTELTGVPKGERAPERRLTQRNGYSSSYNAAEASVRPSIGCAVRESPYVMTSIDRASVAETPESAISRDPDPSRSGATQHDLLASGAHPGYLRWPWRLQRPARVAAD